MVGELVINQAMLAQAIESAGLGGVGSDVGMGLDELKQLSREIQEGVMAIRAQPVKPLFDRMHRIVRESAEASGKTARLVTEGETTEVDKTVVEKLADPLTHMIRNAVDHGLETAEERDRGRQARRGHRAPVGAAPLGPGDHHPLRRWRRHQPRRGCARSRSRRG